MSSRHANYFNIRILQLIVVVFLALTFSSNAYAHPSSPSATPSPSGTPRASFSDCATVTSAEDRSFIQDMVTRENHSERECRYLRRLQSFATRCARTATDRRLKIDRKAENELIEAALEDCDV